MALRGADHPNWKGDDASLRTKYRRAGKYPLTQCERCPEPGAIRHHRDRDPGNDAPENIEILCKACHTQEHDRRLVKVGDGRGALILNEVLPVEVREALDKEGERRNLHLNDIAGEILAKHFKLEWTYSGNEYRTLAERFKLRVPEHLHWKLRMAAALEGHTVRGTALATIAKHYRLPAITPTRRPRRQTP